MKTTMLSKFLYGTAIIAVIISIGQWFLRVQDPSQLVFGLNVALSIVIIAYIHSGFRNLGNEARKEKELKDKQVEELNTALDAAINYSRELENKFLTTLK